MGGHFGSDTTARLVTIYRHVVHDALTVWIITMTFEGRRIAIRFDPSTSRYAATTVTGTKYSPLCQYISSSHDFGMRPDARDDPID